MSERQRAVEQLRKVAKPYRFRVRADAEGFPIIPGRYGRIEWHCDGVNCHACPLPGQVALGVYTDRPRLFSKIWSIPGVRRQQTGDTEMRAVFPVEALEQVATLIRAYRKPGIGSELAKKIGASTAFGGTSRAENARSGPTPNPRPWRSWKSPEARARAGACDHFATFEKTRRREFKPSDGATFGV